MIITDFTMEHVEAAERLAQRNYEAARRVLDSLPEAAVPGLGGFAENRMGVAALENGALAGYLCAYGPFENAFASTGVRGVWSPLHGNGAVAENRAGIYHRMYEAAGRKWAAAGAPSHSVTLYSSDRDAVDAMFAYGFGMRCMDTIRMITREELSADPYRYEELPREGTALTTPLRNGLMAHLGESPCFMPFGACDEEDTRRTVAHRDSRSVIIRDGESVVGYMEMMKEGETFVCDAPDMMNICGAYLLPEYRGRGLYTQLLRFLMNTLYDEGYRRLGVDFESFNPTARGFWLKHFTQYTASLARRVDHVAK